MRRYKETEIFYAKRGQYVTLDGRDYVGEFHQMVGGGALMTGPTHSPDSEVIVPVGSETATSGILGVPNTNTTLDENTTEYDLLPVIVNRRPDIVSSLAEASSPTIRPYHTANASGDSMYEFEDGGVRVIQGAQLTLRVEASQPDVYNVESGKLVIKPPKSELSYNWTFDGEPLDGQQSTPTLGARRTVNGNELIIEGIIPAYAGLYGCTVANDIGTTDAGTVELVVYDDALDTFYYTNLIENPNGESGVDSWNSVNGELEAKQLESKTVGRKHKSIVADPMNPPFNWTSEMLEPKPYQVDSGRLLNNSISNLQNYFTRTKYNYTVNGGSPVVRAYQEIDLSELEYAIRGSLYGVSGLRGVFSCYIGNAIFNYEVASPYILPDTRADKLNYYLAAPRLSLENFLKNGPGFVKEKVYVTLEEYASNGEKLQSRDEQGNLLNNTITIHDPWNRRLPNYANQVYYNGDKNFVTPDQPTLGDSRDAHLFVADELFPEYKDRYTYGQHAEFSKFVIERLNPRTTKVRITLNIEAPELRYRLRDRDLRIADANTLYEVATWEGVYESMRVAGKSNFTTKVFDEITEKYRVDQPVSQRVPKASVSRAFISGLNFALVPIRVGREDQTAVDVASILAKNTRVSGLIPAPFEVAPPFDARDQGNRTIDILFTRESVRSISITLTENNTDIPGTEPIALPFTSGLFPQLDVMSMIMLTKTDPGQPGVDGSQYKGEVSKYTHAFYSPLYVAASNKARLDIPQKYVKDLPLSSKEEIEVRYRRDNGTYIERTKKSERGGFSAQRGSNSSVDFKLADGVDQAKYHVAQLRKGPNQKLDRGVRNARTYTPVFPAQWYMIEQQDRIKLYEKRASELDSEAYRKWATCLKPLTIDTYVSEWNAEDNPQNVYGGKGSLTKQTVIKTGQSSWHNCSRFVITLGVHNNANNNEATTYQNYYLDMFNDKVVFHKTKNLMSNGDYLPSFTEDEFFESNIEFRNFGVGNNGPFESYEPTDTLNFSERSVVMQDMEPLIVDLGGSDVSIQSLVETSTQFELPIELLTQSPSEGGLGIPVSSSQAEITLNTVEAATVALNAIAAAEAEQAPANLIDMYAKETEATIVNALTSEIDKATVAASLNAKQAIFVGEYDFTKPYNDPSQLEPKTLKQPVDKNSRLMTLLLRRYAIEQAFKNRDTSEISVLITTLQENFVINNGNGITIKASVDSTPDLNPNFDVIIAGVRPAVGGKLIDWSYFATLNKNTSVRDRIEQSVQRNKLVATPTGGKSGNFTYTINQISIENTSTKDLEDVPKIQNTPDEQLSLAED